MDWSLSTVPEHKEEHRDDADYVVEPGAPRPDVEPYLCGNRELPKTSHCRSQRVGKYCESRFHWDQSRMPALTLAQLDANSVSKRSEDRRRPLRFWT